MLAKVDSDTFKQLIILFIVIDLDITVWLGITDKFIIIIVNDKNLTSKQGSETVKTLNIIDNNK